jgi:hypothetical protein
MFAADVFISVTNRQCVYNISLIDNIPSIMQYGIVSYYQAKRIPHQSIAMNEVQDRRAKVSIPNGGKLHSYANLYFDYHNPMMYRRQDQAEEMCVLAIHCSILNLPDSVVSDRNAASDYARFYEPLEAMYSLDFPKIYAKNWNHDDPIEKATHKSIKCAEILIPNQVPYSYVCGAYVMNQEAKVRMTEMGFDKKTVINPAVFFRQEM